MTTPPQNTPHSHIKQQSDGTAIKNSMLRVQKYLDRLATAKRYNQECIHSFLEGWDGETPLLVADLKALCQLANAVLAARTLVDSVQEDDDIDAVALARYKVVPAHESMFHRFAVVAGDGKQQLYLGREVECENMARKFAGAFLDGAFYQANITLPTQASEYPALVCDYCGALTPDPWHSSGMLHGKMSKHIHSCDACAAQTKQGEQP